MIDESVGSIRLHSERQTKSGEQWESAQVDGPKRLYGIRRERIICLRKEVMTRNSVNIKPNNATLS